MIGVIADDLTGAAEIGAVGLRHGLRAELLLGGNPGGNADLLCVDTDSRSCPPTEAARRCADAARLLTSAGAQWIYKKVDSVLRGQITAEINALLAELHLPLAFLIPANPSRGRTIQNGLYFVQGKPIHETEFARDPEYPRTSPRALDLLTTSGPSDILVRAPQDPLPDHGIILGEVASVNDLHTWAARKSNNILAAGGAEFFAALLARHKPSNPISPTAKRVQSNAKEIFVCGSTSASSREFVTALRQQGTPVFSLPAVAGDPHFNASLLEPIASNAAAALHSHPRIILNVGLPVISDKAISKMLAVYLAQLAHLILRQSPPGLVGHFYAEGGATAKELVHCIGWHRFTVLEEVAPGTATLLVNDESTLNLTIKPGSYPWPQTLWLL